MSRFEQLEGGHFLDQKTNIVWKEHTENSLYTWENAKELENDDWRLPTIGELKGILSKKRHSGQFSKLPNMTPHCFWSSSPCAYDSNYVWIVDFDGASHYTTHKISIRAARLVRR
jgi:hypothetical protein